MPLLPNPPKSFLVSPGTFHLTEMDSRPSANQDEHLIDWAALNSDYSDVSETESEFKLINWSFFELLEKPKESVTKPKVELIDWSLFDEKANQETKPKVEPPNYPTPKPSTPIPMPTDDRANLVKFNESNSTIPLLLTPPPSLPDDTSNINKSNEKPRPFRLKRRSLIRKVQVDKGVVKQEKSVTKPKVELIDWSLFDEKSSQEKIPKIETNEKPRPFKLKRRSLIRNVKKINYDKIKKLLDRV